MHLPKRWWVGLPILAGLAYVANNSLTPRIEAALRAHVAERLAESPEAVDSPRVSVNGRDVTISGVALSLDEKRRVFAMLGPESGARTLNDATEPLGVASPFTLRFERRGGRVAISGNVPVSAWREKMRGDLEAMGLQVEDTAGFAQGAPANFADIAGFALKRLAELDPADVTVSDGTLSLSGEARNSEEYTNAMTALKAAPVAGDALKADLSPPRVTPYVFSATLTGGVVALSGHLPNDNLRRKVVALASQAGAGAAVSDVTELGAGAPAGNYDAALALAVSELSKLSQGKVTLIDGRVSIEGQGRNNVHPAMLQNDVRESLPKGFELAKLDVAAGPVSPYVFGAERRGGAVTLTGYAPDEQTRDRLVEIARKRFFDAAVVDKMLVAKGAPSAFLAATEHSLNALARLAEGRVALNGGTATLSGAARYEAARGDIERGFVDALPQNFRGEALLSTRTIGANLDAPRCGAEIGGLLAKSAITFSADDATLSADSVPLVDAVAAAALRCPDARFDVVAHSHGPDIAELKATRSKRRAQTVVDALVKAGVDPFRIQAVGHEAQAASGSPNGGDVSRDRLIEFVVK